MDRKTDERDWAAMKSYARREWEALTEDDLADAGNQERLVSLIQARYGITREEAARQVADWASRL